MVVFAGLVSFGLGVAAQTTAGGTVEIVPPITGTLVEIIQKIIGFLAGLALIICPIIIVYGGFILMSSNGEPAKTTEGRRIITYALVGLIIMFVAQALVKMIAGILGVV